MIKQQMCKRWQFMFFPFSPWFVSQEQALAKYNCLEQGQEVLRAVGLTYMQMLVAFKLCRLNFALHTNL